MSAAAVGTRRHRMADQLRGISLWGIVLVNAPFIAISSQGYDDASLQGAWNQGIAMLVVFAAEGKFYLLFSLLFGYSSTFIVRAGQPLTRRRYLRRLAALAVLGLLHAVFFFVGDILVSYALLGLVLLAVMNWANAWVMRFAAVCWAVASGWLVLVVVEVAANGAGQFAAAQSAFDQAMADGSFWQAAWARVQALPEVLLTLASLQWGLALAAFCVGMVAGRKQLFAEPESRSDLWRRLAIWGLALGVPLQLAATLLSFGVGDVSEAAGLALGFITAPVMSAGYVGVLGMLCARRPRALAFLEPAGRTSLTVYLGESVLLCALYCGWGLGWYGTQGALAVTAAATLVWGVLSVGAWLWLTRHRRGPLESVMLWWTRLGEPTSRDAAHP